jgi:two-component system, NtrC family, sensor kinase
MKNWRNLAGGVLAIALAGTLGFLYWKSEAIDFKKQSLILSYLRELKDIDAKWNEELLRSRFESGRSNLPPRDFAEALRRALAGLSAESAGSPAITQGIDALRKAFEEKAAAVEKYKAQSAELREALGNMAASMNEVQAMVRGAVSARAKLRDRYSELEATLLEVQSEVLKYNQSPDDRQKSRVDSALATVRSAEGQHAPPVGPAIARLGHQVDAVLQKKPAENEMFSKVSFLTAGPRVDSLTAAFSREIESTLQDKELYRIYLASFALSLLVLLGYAGSQLVQSYKLLADANTALQEANEGLEQRVQVRTRELSQALKQLEESQAMLVQTEKMSSLGQMVAGVAHEINTPLAYVKNSLETVDTQLAGLMLLVGETEKLLGMLRGGATNQQALAAQFALVTSKLAELRGAHSAEDLASMVKDGRYGIEQIAEIVTNLKDFSRLDRSKVDKFNLADGVESTLVIAKHLLKSVDVQKNLGKVPPITCSPSQINQVLLNLITNAAQATDGKPGGKITITTRPADATHVAVEVEDNGKGIPPEVLPKIFDPFFTTKDVGQGTGLGLSIVYKIIASHGGKINVSSQVGMGSKFTVTLPVHTPAPAPAV